ncbi:MAG: hypothetical protein U1E65_18160 [Myxococcota bacterium]
MGSVSLDQILRSLEPRGEVRFALGDVPVDELLLTLHETRFTGTVELGRTQHSDKVSMKGGRVLDVVPSRFLHVKLLADVLRDLDFVPGGVLRKLIEEDASADGEGLSRRLVSRGLITYGQLKEAIHEQARRRLFFLYDHSGGPAIVRQGLPRTAQLDLDPVDLMPAVAYGIVVRAHPRRRQAMLAFASHKRARLHALYDPERNRCGLPSPLLEAAAVLSQQPVTFGAVPCLEGLTPDTTAGLLLLFQRIALLELLEVTERTPLPDRPAPTTARPTQVIRRAAATR